MLIFLSIVLLLGLGAYIGYKRIKPMMGSKNLIKRDGAFWEDGELLYTCAPCADVFAAVNHEDRWTAALQYYGLHNNEHKYEFQFLRWDTHNLGTSIYSMNILLTIVEKIFLSLDPDTEAEIHIVDTETETRFL